MEAPFGQLHYSVGGQLPHPPSTGYLEFQQGENEEWQGWLPSASTVPGESGDDKLTLNFKVKADNDPPDMKYMVRLRLHPTGFPGRWTNDYVALENGLPPEPITKYQNVEYVNVSWKNPVDPSAADLYFEPDENPGWIIDWIVESYGSGPSAHSFCAATYSEPVANGDLVSINVSSFDFGAGGYVYVELSESASIPQNPNGIEPFAITNGLYQRQREPQWYLPYLPIPRDEDFDHEVDGNEIVFLLGDGMADAWEEEFVNPDQSVWIRRDIPVPNREIYQDIQAMLPKADDSWSYSSFMPYNNHPMSDLYNIRRLGDGLANFEKYRAFYGITNSFGVIEEPKRLKVQSRNIFVIHLIDPDLVQRGYTFDPIFITFDAGELNVNHLAPNPDWNVYQDEKHKYYLSRGTTISNYPDYPTQFQQLWQIMPDNNTQNGCKEINGVYLYPEDKEHLPISAIWCNSFYDYPNDFLDIFRRWNVPLPTENGVTFGFDGDAKLPVGKLLCAVNIESVRNDLINSGYSGNELYNKTLFWGEYTQSHELGHFIGMDHNNANTSIMQSPMNMYYDVRCFEMYDYRFFQLSGMPLRHN
ncbi:hypothetical protein KQI52_13375 [bacterium]|nr:hypothetical protein [bacterium]